MRSSALVFASIAVVAIACGDGSVHRYAPCTATDTCPSSTTCEASTPQGQTFCTSTCASSHDCANDDTGAEGVCTSNVGPTSTVTPFCYAPCPANGCPGGACASVVSTETAVVTVCIPGLTNALDGTSWTSTTIATQGKSAAVTASSYSVTFASGQFSSDTITVTGAFSATFTQTYSASSPSVYAGCTETTTFTAGTWTTTADATEGSGRLVVSGVVGSTDRTGCVSATKNITGAPGVYDAVMNVPGGAPFTVQNGTLTISGGGSALPYSDKVDWTFSKT